MKVKVLKRVWRPYIIWPLLSDFSSQESHSLAHSAQPSWGFSSTQDTPPLQEFCIYPSCCLESSPSTYLHESIPHFLQSRLKWNLSNETFSDPLYSNCKCLSIPSFIFSIILINTWHPICFTFLFICPH